MSTPETSDEVPVPFPVKGRLLGIDYGTVRVGIAICDAERIISSPLDTYTRRDAANDAAYFQTLIRAEKIVGIVVGLAIHTNGDEGIKAKECREYGRWLGETTGLPIAFCDERFTTSLAEDAMISAGLNAKKRKGRRDRVAAQLILQGFLEADRQFLRKQTM